MVDMKRLTTTDRVKVIKCLVEGCSIRSTCRMTGVAKNTVAKLLVDMGSVCREWHDRNVRGLYCKKIQADEIWAFCGCKKKAKKAGASGHGDIWTWTALDPDSKLIVSYLVGERNGAAAFDFMHDLAGRLMDRIHLTTDGLAAYIDAVIENFGEDVDYFQLIKLFGNDPKLTGHAERKYSPSKITSCECKWIAGNPLVKGACTSHVERQNLTMRMSMRRYTRLTNAFSKKVENHEAMTALHFMYYNWCRPHASLKGKTPAMAAGIAHEVWTVEDMVKLLEAKEKAAIGTDTNKRGPYRRKAGISD